jgi:hypothetical protein
MALLLVTLQQGSKSDDVRLFRPDILLLAQIIPSCKLTLRLTAFGWTCRCGEAAGADPMSFQGPGG